MMFIRDKYFFFFKKNGILYLGSGSKSISNNTHWSQDIKKNKVVTDQELPCWLACIVLDVM